MGSSTAGILVTSPLHLDLWSSLPALARCRSPSPPCRGLPAPQCSAPAVCHCWGSPSFTAQLQGCEQHTALQGYGDASIHRGHLACTPNPQAPAHPRAPWTLWARHLSQHTGMSPPAWPWGCVSMQGWVTSAPTPGCWPISPGAGTVVSAQPRALSHCCVLSVRAALLDSIRGCAASRLLVRATGALSTWFLLPCLFASRISVPCLCKVPQTRLRVVQHCSHTEHWAGHCQGKLAAPCPGWWDWAGLRLGAGSRCAAGCGHLGW